MTRQIDGVDRAMARFRAVAAAAAIERHCAPDVAAGFKLPTQAREVPDKLSMLGMGVIVVRQPPWRRQDWAEPQRPPTRPRRP